MVMPASSLMGGVVHRSTGEQPRILECSLGLVSLPRDRFGGHGPRPGVAAPCRGPSVGQLLAGALLSGGRGVANRVTGLADFQGLAELRWPFAVSCTCRQPSRPGKVPVLELGGQPAHPGQLGLPHGHVVLGFQQEQPGDTSQPGKLGAVAGYRLLQRRDPVLEQFQRAAGGSTGSSDSAASNWGYSLTGSRCSSAIQSSSSWRPASVISVHGALGPPARPARGQPPR